MAEQDLIEVLTPVIALWEKVSLADGPIDPHLLGEENRLANSHGNINEHSTTLKFALIGHLLETVRASNENISVGLEINKLMWFHAMEMSTDTEFWREKYKENESALQTGFKSAIASRNMAIEVIKEQAKDPNALQSPLKQLWDKELSESIAKFSNERSRLERSTATYNELHQKIKRGEPHYSESQRPENAGTNLSKYFLNLHLHVSTTSAEEAAMSSVYVAETLLVHGSFLEQRKIPSASPTEAARLSGNVAKMKNDVTPALERAVAWLNVHEVSQNYHFPLPPNPS